MTTQDDSDQRLDDQAGYGNAGQSGAGQSGGGGGNDGGGDRDEDAQNANLSEGADNNSANRGGDKSFSR